MQAARAPETNGLDTERPNLARVYQNSLGGKDNYPVDRKAWEQISTVTPHLGNLHRMNRSWAGRVVRSAAQNAGIDQFLDLGAGLPDYRNTHDFAQEMDSTVRVVYVDSDPLCVAHGRALLERNDCVHYVPGDLADPEQIWEKSEARVYLDLDRPLCLLLSGVVHHISDDRRPGNIMAHYAQLLPAGSYIAVSHYLDPGPMVPALHSLARDVEQAFLDSLGTGWFRTRAQILDLFGGLELVPPGLVGLQDWWPLGPNRQLEPAEHLMVGGLAYKARSGARCMPYEQVGASSCAAASMSLVTPSSSQCSP
ncbi:SAM-dependent methyltransferase [Nocardia carnea]|uniref:SAM-dependent methyltransferase n=1 Tax=Nocardia carnea TaxID=37328 RepID=UPI0024570689|nr:SAM-dependent methyltransferase [Nocardia carnea]